ncbi:MAG TPA: type II toxin-antitoxin system HipA family toxin [Solirubrobacterales bacterium]|jgi:serine/threonine-protein kinase HipA|nr:type II toxin-antitoxin system HipA family toxin [Solirubrobacterales bacterium]
MSPATVSELEVFLHDDTVGRLERLPQGRLRFTYDPAWAEAGRRPLSLSLPVRPDPYEDDRCGPFFEGLLPEGDFLRAVARAFHVSADNPFSVLAEIGGECAGAVSVGAVGEGVPGPTSPPPRWLPEDAIGDLLDQMPKRPLVLLEQIEEEDGIRISLAGAHDKTGVLVRDGQLGLTAGRPPSTHILKLPIARVAEPIANEAYCMTLAAETGLEVAPVEPRRIGDHEFLLVRRYDRAPDGEGRIHQEDFCQALGISPADKYEGEGGPGVAACATLLRRGSAPAADLPEFLDCLLFNFLIGNHDAHAKNFSLLLDGPRAIRLAPFYDLLSTVVFEGTRKKLAMRLGGENRPKYLRRRHLDRLADELEVKPALVSRRIDVIVAAVRSAQGEARHRLPTEFQDRPIIDRVDAVIEERAERLLKARSEEP